MIKIEGNLYDRYMDVERRDVIYSESLNNQYNHPFTIIKTYLVDTVELVNGSSRIDVYNSYGLGKQIHQTFTIAERIIDIVSVNNTIVMLTASKVYFINVTDLGVFQTPTSISNTINTIDYDVKLKVIDHIVYFTYNRFLITINSTSKIVDYTYDFGRLVTTLDIVKYAKNDIVAVYPISGNSLESRELTTNVVREQLLNINIDGTVSYLKYDKTSSLLYIGSSSGSVFSIQLSTAFNFIGLTVLTVLDDSYGIIEKIDITEDYIIFSSTYSFINILNKETKHSDKIVAPNLQSNIYVNNAMIFHLGTDGLLTTYKLYEMPMLSVTNAKIEVKNNIPDPNLNLYYLNCFTSLNGIRYITKDPSEYDVQLSFDGNVSQTTTFSSVNQTTNIYIPLNNIDEYISTPSFYLNNTGVFYSIINTRLNIEFSSNDRDILDTNNLIDKLSIKDVYMLNDKCYFRLKYLISGNMKLTVSILGKSKTISLFDFSDVKNKYISFWIDQIGTELPIPDHIDITLTLKNESGTILDEIILQSEYVIKDDLRILSRTTDGDIQLHDEIYLTDETTGDKTRYLSNMGNLAGELLINNSSIRVNKDPYIRGNINEESQIGLLEIPVEYSSYQLKSNSIIAEVYINGKKLYRNSIIQKDNLDGTISTYYPVRNLVEFLSTDSYNQLINTGILLSSNRVIVTLIKKNIIESESFLGSYVIESQFQDELNMLKTGGIYIPIILDDKLTVNQIRVFIMNSSSGLLKRVNPKDVSIQLDRKYSQARIIIPGASTLRIGSKIVLVTNGIFDNTLYFNSLDDSSYEIDSIPLVSFDNEDQMYTGIVPRSEDIDVNVNGLTLVPNRDFTIINTSLDDVPTIIAFRNQLPKGSKVEVNFLNENTNHIAFFSEPAIGTTNKFTLSSDEYLFIPGTFEVFMNNMKIDDEYYNIIDSRTIEMVGFGSNIVYNVMVRFGYEGHVNLKPILDDFKYSNIDMNQTLHHSKTILIQNSFDVLCANKRSTSVNNLLLSELMLFDNDRNIDANADSGLWDIVISPNSISGKYVRDDIDIDMNINGVLRSIKPSNVLDPEL